jgi:hypothetical protein
MRTFILACALLVTWRASADDEQPPAPLLITEVTTPTVVLYDEAFNEAGRLSEKAFRELFFEDVSVSPDVLPAPPPRAVKVVAPVNPALRMYGVLDKRPEAVASGTARVVFLEGNSVKTWPDGETERTCPGSVRALVAEPQKDVTTGFGGCEAQ